MLDFKIPVQAFQDRWRIMPLYMIFIGDGLFTAEHALFQYVRITPADKPFVATARDFGDHYRRKRKAPSCPVTRVVATYGKEGMTIEFKWADRTVVTAPAGLKGKNGRPAKKPLDLNTNGAQVFDSVEFIFDLRPKTSLGRFNCAVGRTPEGAVRIGIYKIREDNKIIAKLMLPAGLERETVSLEQKDADTFLLHFKKAPTENTISWSMRVSDANKFGNGRLHLLTGKRDISPEPMGYIRHGRNDTPAMFFRVGY